MLPLSSTAGAALAIHTPPPPPAPEPLLGLLHHTFAGAPPPRSLEVSHATTQPDALPCPSPPANATTTAFAPPGFVASASPARWTWRYRLKPCPPTLLPSIGD